MRSHAIRRGPLREPVIANMPDKVGEDRDLEDAGEAGGAGEAAKSPPAGSTEASAKLDDDAHPDPLDEQPTVEDEIELVEGEPIENTNLRRIAESLPPEKRTEFFAVIRRERMSHSGWLPTPEFMKQYDLALPGLAERIVALPEREQSFRHNTTKDIVSRDYKLRTTGQWMGLAALAMILAFCAFLTIWGFGKQAAWVAGTVIIGTVGVFVTGQLFNAGSSTSKDIVEA